MGLKLQPEPLCCWKRISRCEAALQPSFSATPRYPSRGWRRRADFAVNLGRNLCRWRVSRAAPKTAEARRERPRGVLWDHAPEREIDSRIDWRGSLRHLMKPKALGRAPHHQPVTRFQFKRYRLLCPAMPELKSPRSA
jgi:hypothetical protein